MNTVLELMYRDAGNYKSFRTEVVSGEINTADWQSILATLDMGENFVAEQVGLTQPEASSGLDPELDHGFTSLLDVEDGPKYTDDGPTVSLTARELVTGFLAVDTWNPMLGANFPN